MENQSCKGKHLHSATCQESHALSLPTPNDDAGQNPQSLELGFIRPQSSKTDAVSDPASVRAIDEELKQLRHHDQQDQHPSGFNGGFKDHFDEGELHKTLDEDIQQVIFEEALNEEVMNLALEDRNSIEADKELLHFTDDGIYGLSLGVNGTEFVSARSGFSGLKEPKIYQNNGDEKEENRMKNLVDKEESNGWGSIEDENLGEEDSCWEEGDDGAFHITSNESVGGGYNGGRDYSRRFQYPLRPDAEDCAYYMKTGNCKFAANCKFNHPPRRKNQGIKEKAKPRVEDAEQLGQTECKYYLTSGGCKYGKSCKFNHSKERSAVNPMLEFNFLGLPIRLGEKECPYYMRTGSCKYGSNCRFNHPDPTSVARTDHHSSQYVNGGSISFPSATPKSTPSWSSVPMILPPHQGVTLSNSEWNGYQAPVYSMSETSLPTPPAFAMNNQATEANFYAPHQPEIPVEEYPERPGQPECTYFLKTGDCKYKANCRFHHPKICTSNSSSCPLSDKGLPLRPDQSVCTYYNRYGICKFGPACKFDHPENWGNLASSNGASVERKQMEAGLSPFDLQTSF